MTNKQAAAYLGAAGTIGLAVHRIHKAQGGKDTEGWKQFVVACMCLSVAAMVLRTPALNR